MVNLIRNFFKGLLGLALAPLVVSASVAFYNNFLATNALWTGLQIYFIYGIAAYACIHLFLFKPTYPYLIGHELVHVFATWLSFGKVTSFHIAESGGAVTTSKNNSFISLSPYFVPFYTVLAILVYYGLTFLTPMDAYTKHLIFLLGFTMALHIIMTVHTLKTKQPDLMQAGYLTSLVIIYVINVLVTAAVLSLLFDSFTFRPFWDAFVAHVRGLYAHLYGIVSIKAGAAYAYITGFLQQGQ